MCVGGGGGGLRGGDGIGGKLVGPICKDWCRRMPMGDPSIWTKMLWIKGLLNQTNQFINQPISFVVQSGS